LDDVIDTENPALTRPKSTTPPRPWELIIERDDLHAAASLALAVKSCADTPGWLRDKADEVAEDIGWWSTWGEGTGPGRVIRMVPVLMHWNGAYSEMVAEVSARHPRRDQTEVPGGCDPGSEIR
jgi:hypothetical protein